MSTSYLETVRSAFITELDGIDGTGVYRNTVKEVYQDLQSSIPSFPSLEFLFGQGQLLCKDSAWTIYELDIPFFIYCNIRADTSTTATSNLLAAQDSLLHDIMRVIATLYTKNINAASGPRWHVVNNPPVIFDPIVPMGENEGWFLIKGMIHIRNMTGSFS